MESRASQAWRSRWSCGCRGILPTVDSGSLLPRASEGTHAGSRPAPLSRSSSAHDLIQEELTPPLNDPGSGNRGVVQWAGPLSEPLFPFYRLTAWDAGSMEVARYAWTESSLAVPIVLVTISH